MSSYLSGPSLHLSSLRWEEVAECCVHNCRSPRPGSCFFPGHAASHYGNCSGNTTLGIEFLLGYKSFFQITGIDYSEELILDKLLDIYGQCVELSNALEKLNLRLGVTSELVADVLQLVTEVIPRIPFGTQPFDVDFTKLLPKYSQFSYQSILGSIGFLTQATFNQGQSVLSATRCTNVGEKVDALLSYYELQLRDAQQLSANHQHLLQS